MNEEEEDYTDDSSFNINVDDSSDDSSDEDDDSIDEIDIPCSDSSCSSSSDEEETRLEKKTRRLKLKKRRKITRHPFTHFRRKENRKMSESDKLQYCFDYTFLAPR